MQKKRKLVVASGNAHKLREISEIFTELGKPFGYAQITIKLN